MQYCGLLQALEQNSTFSQLTFDHFQIHAIQSSNAQTMGEQTFLLSRTTDHTTQDFQNGRMSTARNQHRFLSQDVQSGQLFQSPARLESNELISNTTITIDFNHSSCFTDNGCATILQNFQHLLTFLLGDVIEQLTDVLAEISDIDRHGHGISHVVVDALGQALIQETEVADRQATTQHQFLQTSSHLNHVSGRQDTNEFIVQLVRNIHAVHVQSGVLISRQFSINIFHFQDFTNISSYHGLHFQFSCSQIELPIKDQRRTCARFRQGTIFYHGLNFCHVVGVTTNGGYRSIVRIDHAGGTIGLTTQIIVQFVTQVFHLRIPFFESFFDGAIRELHIEQAPLSWVMQLRVRSIITHGAFPIGLMGRTNFDTTRIPDQIVRTLEVRFGTCGLVIRRIDLNFLHSRWDREVRFFYHRCIRLLRGLILHCGGLRISAVLVVTCLITRTPFLYRLKRFRWGEDHRRRHYQCYWCWLRRACCWTWSGADC
ncbi:hypothetical protein AVT69_gp139 [Pseudomonas phage PhiPA3]|uniref:Uncharacterized protein 141 n=1 Tax=Pseudomonas phage PhiPA3 TaxID=998086 RepID=F8SK14_BPPA3|nr:hypothetical protein AVT69_gp139 [Pseudomonas phage PhiPA3]AEH03564.1 hypothetical protein [Pseudomonas phage PhiPA3]